MNNEINISSALEHHQHTLELIQSATRSIVIHCHDLSPRNYNYPDITDALSKFITGNSAQRNIRISISDVNIIINCDHKILNTCRRLSSSAFMHKIAKEHEGHTGTFIIADERTFILRNDYTLFDGKLIKDIKQAKEQLNLFNEIWSHSRTDSDLNRLYL